MTSSLVLDGMSSEQFAQLVELLVQWVSSRKLTIRIRLPATIEFDLQDLKLRQQLEQHDLPSESVGQINNDIPVMLSGILTGTRNAAIGFLAQHAERPDDGDIDDGVVRDEIKSRVELVEGGLLTDALRTEYAIKRGSNNNVFDDVSWDIVERLVANDGKMSSGLVYANVRVAAQKPSAGEDYFIPGSVSSILGLGGDRETVSFAMTEEDIERLAVALEKASEAIRQVRQDRQETRD